MTTPVDEVLPLPHSPEIQGELDFCHDALHEAISFGSHVLKWSTEKVTFDTFNQIAPPLHFRHMLEILDGVASQVKDGIVEPTKIQLRAVLETRLGLEYLLADDAQFETRCACFRITEESKSLSSFRRWVEIFRADIARETVKENLPEKKRIMRKGKALVKSTQERIAKTGRPDVLTEYKRTKKANGSHSTKWYSLFGGPTNVEELAEILGKTNEYESLYRTWSNPTHGSDLIFSGLFWTDEETLGILQLRTVGNLYAVTQRAVVQYLAALELMTDKVVPERQAEIVAWYQQFKQQYLAELEHRYQVNEGY